MAFCNQCGTQLTDEDMFCPSCGTPVVPAGEPAAQTFEQNEPPRYEAEPQNPEPASYYKEPSKGASFVKGLFTGKMKWITCGIIAAIVVIIILIAAVGGGIGKPYEAPVRSVMNVVAKKQFNKSGLKTIFNAMPPEVREAVLEQEDADDFDELYEDSEDSMEDTMDMMEDYKISYEIKKSEQLKKKEIKAIEERYEDYMDVDLDINDAYSVKVKMVMNDDGDKEKNTFEVNSIKVGGKWYIDMYTLGSTGIHF